MKKFLLAGAAIALIAGPVAAQDWTAQTYGNDGAAWWALEADVDTFCRLNNGNTGVSGTNATVTPGSNGQSGSAANNDGTIVLDIQDDATNTVNAAFAQVRYPNSQCNTTFNVRAESTNGGLENDDFGGQFEGPFIETLPYRVNAQIGSSQGVSTLTTQGAFNLGLENIQPTAGDFSFNIFVPASGDLLLEGEYSDFLKVTMAAVSTGS